MPVSRYSEDDGSVPTSAGTALPLLQQQSSTEAKGLTIGTWFWVIITIALVALLSLGYTWKNLFLSVLALLPGIVLVYLVFKYLPDNALNPSFLTMQLVIGAFPLSVLVSLFYGLTFLVFSIFLALTNEKWTDNFTAYQNAYPPSTSGPDNNAAFLKVIRDTFPDWELATYVILWSYFSCAIAEASKWVIARRYRGLIADALLTPTRDIRSPTGNIGVRGVLASSCMVAIGFAAFRSLISVRSPPSDLSVGIFGTIWGSSLLFCIEVGPLFYIALAHASRVIIQDPRSFMLSFLVAVCIHGTFELFRSLNELGFLGIDVGWLGSVAPVVEVILVVALFWLCYSQYRKIRAKERVMMGSGMF